MAETKHAHRPAKERYTTAVTPAAFVFSAAMAALAVLASQLTYSPQSLQPPPRPEATARPGFTLLDLTEEEETRAVRRYVGALKFPTVSYTPDAKPDNVERLKSKSDGDPFFEMHAYLREQFPRVLQSLKKEIVNERSLLYTWEAKQGQVGCPTKPLLAALITAHLDVVHPGPLSQWSSPPFVPVLNNKTGYVVGRGALDDKIGILALLEATERLLSEGFMPCRTYYYAFGHDEEVGGREGAMRISKILQERGSKLAFILDEGYVVTDRALEFIEGPFALIGVAEKGNARVNLRFSHHGGHGSSPSPISAVTAMAGVIHELANRPMAAEVTNLQREMFKYLAPEAKSPLFRIALANLWLFEPLILRMMLTNPHAAAIIRTSISANVVKAGTGANIIANVAEVGLDCRIVPGQTVADVVNYLVDSIRRVITNVEIRIRPLASTLDYDRVTVEEGNARPLVGEDRPSSGGRNENAVVAEIFTFDDWNTPPSPVAETNSHPWFGVLSGTLKRVFAYQEMVGIDGRKKGGVKGVTIAPGLLFGNTDSRHYWNLTTNIYRFTPMFVPKEHIKTIHGIDEQIHKDSYLKAIEFYHEFLRSVDEVDR